jgi:N-methylhydantoinase B
MSGTTRPRRLDAVDLALFRGLFAACAAEMGLALERSAWSPNIKERLDHSCAVFDSRGRLVAQAAHIPVHLGSLPLAVEAAIRDCDPGPGDVVLLNDPFAGGTHLPDLTCVSAVTLGRGAPDFYLASRAHHADVGGSAPGSMPLAREIYEEGLRLPPVRLMQGGRRVTDVWRLLLANVRTPEEREGDLAAQLAAHATGERRLREWAKRRGAGALRSATAALIGHGERLVRARLAQLPRGRYRFADALDDDGRGGEPVRIAVEVTLGGGRARADFRGSSGQVPGPVNAPPVVTGAAARYAFLCLLGEDVPVNHGSLGAIEVVTRRGSVLDPEPPAAVSAGNVETSQRVVDVVLGALARACPERVPAASAGTMNNLLVGGTDPRDGRPFAYYETLAGGHGAGPGWPGESGMQAHMTNTRNTPVEALEHAYPLRVLATRLRRGSGGAGRFRGGAGVVREIELLSRARVGIVAERRRFPPYGLRGGKPGARGVNSVRRPGGAWRTVPGKFELDLPKGSMVRLASPGGGGYGRPSRRARATRVTDSRRAPSRPPAGGARRRARR